MWSLARAQVQLGIDARVFAVEAGHPQQDPPHPAVVVIAQRNRARFGISAAWRIARHAPDAVHLHSRPEIAVALRTFGYRGPIVLSFDFPLMLPAVLHRVGGGGYGRGLGWGLTKVIDLFLPTSDYATLEYRARGGRIPPGRGPVLWNGTDCPEPPPRPRPEKPQALFVGRFVEQKGADLFVAAGERLPDWSFVAVGPLGEFHTGPGDPTGVAALGRVDHRGPLPDAEVAELMAGATCLVLPTREWEVFGMVLIEALAHGTPVVASDAAGPAEILPGCRAAHLFPPGDLDALVAAIEAAGKDDDAVRHEAKEFAQRFSWPSLAAQSLELYGAAQAGRSRRRTAVRRIRSGSVTVQPAEGSAAKLRGFVERMSEGYVQPSLLAWRAREAVLYRQPDRGTVIDLGAGFGHFTREIAPAAVAVDLDLDQLQAGLGAGSYGAAVCADISRLPFRAGAAASVMSNCVLEHLEDLPGALAEVHRVLVPEGTLQTTVPLEAINDAYLFRSKRYHGLRNRQLSHRTLLSLEGWRDLFRLHGFEPVREAAAVTAGEGRRWDLLDAPLFAGMAGKTGFGAYVKLLRKFPSLERPHRHASKVLAHWILAGRRDPDVPICEYLELRPSHGAG